MADIKENSNITLSLPKFISGLIFVIMSTFSLGKIYWDQQVMSTNYEITRSETKELSSAVVKISNILERLDEGQKQQRVEIEKANKKIEELDHGVRELAIKTRNIR